MNNKRKEIQSDPPPPRFRQEERSFIIYPDEAAVGESRHFFVILHPTRARWVIVNRTGLIIARRLEQGETPTRIARHLMDHYQVSPTQVRSEIEHIRSILRTEGLLSGSDCEGIRRPALRSLFLHLTDSCNLHCLHCYTTRSSCTGSSRIDTTAVRKLLHEAADLGGKSVTLSGGEPLLHPGLREIIEEFSGRLSISLLTNGTLIDEPWATFLSKHRVSIQLSLDGSTAEIHDFIRGPGTFAQVKRAITLLQRAGLSDRLNLSTTVMSRNVADLSDIIRLAEKLGIPYVRFLPLRRIGMAREEWQAIGQGLTLRQQIDFYDFALNVYQQKEDQIMLSCGLAGFILRLPEDSNEDGLWCPLGHKLVIAASGDIYPCVLMMEPMFRLGHLATHSLVEVMASAGMNQVCRDVSSRPQQIASCRECSWRNLCQAGCMGLALEANDTIWDTDAFCAYRKKAYRRAFDRLLAKMEAEYSR
ncbi:MAG: radical SAM protein [Acidobacteria bacterium]|nr:radical SAM protein [Acidobacteriota bacterium]